MRRIQLLVLPLLLALAGCGLPSQVSRSSDKLADQTQQFSDLLRNFSQSMQGVQSIVDILKGPNGLMAAMNAMPGLLLDIQKESAALKAAAPEAFTKADKDGDGKLGAGELIGYLLGAGGAGLLAVNRVVGNAKQNMQGQHDAQWDELKALEQKLALLQAQAQKPSAS